MPNATATNPSPPRAAPHARAPRRRRVAGGVLNLTSMIDVIFLLLVFFVVTATFVEDEGVLAAKLPGPIPPPDALPLEPIRVTVHSAGDDLTGYRLAVGSTPVRNFSELTAFLTKLQLDYADPDTPVRIVADGSVRWEHVVNAFNSGVASGYTKVTLPRS